MSIFVIKSSYCQASVFNLTKVQVTRFIKIIVLCELVYVCLLNKKINIKVYLNDNLEVVGLINIALKKKNITFIINYHFFIIVMWKKFYIVSYNSLSISYNMTWRFTLVCIENLKETVIKKKFIYYCPSNVVYMCGNKTLRCIGRRTKNFNRSEVK